MKFNQGGLNVVLAAPWWYESGIKKMSGFIVI